MMNLDGKQMFRKMVIISLFGMIFLSTGCSTPASRIKKYPELFAACSPAVQESIKKGVIDVGYAKDMVFLALGRPAAVFERETSVGKTEVWSYSDMNVWSEPSPVGMWYYYRDSKGRVHYLRDTTWSYRTYTREYESLRVEFESDKVKAIERLLK